MNNQITPFNFHDNPVRIHTDGDTVEYCAKDIAAALGYKDTTNAIKQHCRGVVNRHPILDSLGRTQEAVFIGEGDVYRLIVSSKLPAAVEFEHWLFEEVVPSIRRDGAYVASTGDEDDEMLMARALQAANRALARRDQKLREAQAQLEAQAPKVLFADAVAASDGTCLVGELAKMLTQAGFTIGAVRLFKLLRDDGYLGTCGQNYNVPKQRYIEMGLFRIKETAVTHSDGHITLNRTPKVTGKGQTYFLHKYAPTTSKDLES